MMGLRIGGTTTTTAIRRGFWFTGGGSRRFTSTLLPIVSIEDCLVKVNFNDPTTTSTNKAGAATTGNRFHNIWLRDNCRCPSCFHPVTKQRLVDTFSIPTAISVDSATSTSEGLSIQWKDQENHVSLYPWNWLKRNAYDVPGGRSSSSSDPKPIYWDSNLAADSPLPSVSFEEVMKTEEGVYKWLKNIEIYGLSFISQVPSTTKDTEELALRIGFIRETQYGKFWEITSDLAHEDTAYTNEGLAVHTDNTYFNDPAALQLFHILSHTQGQGGSTLLVDSFHCAAILRDINPTAYGILSKVGVPAHAVHRGEGEEGGERIYKTTYGNNNTPIFSHDNVTGELIQVRWNNSNRSAFVGLPTLPLPLPLPQSNTNSAHTSPKSITMIDFYKALKAWNAILANPQHTLQLRLSETPGTAVIVNNYRVLHGRTGFSGKRRMCGAYIGSDVWRSRWFGLRGRFEDGRGAEDEGVWSLEY